MRKSDDASHVVAGDVGSQCRFLPTPEQGALVAGLVDLVARDPPPATQLLATAAARVAGSSVHEGKQNESDEASPPARRTWCGRSPSKGTKKSGSSTSEPSSRACSSTIHPSMPSG